MVPNRAKHHIILFIFIDFHFIYSWLKITHLHKTKSLFSLYSNNIELIDVNSVTEQEMESIKCRKYKDA